MYPAEYFATKAVLKDQLDNLLLYKHTEPKANTLHSKHRYRYKDITTAMFNMHTYFSTKYNILPSWK